MRDFLFPDLHLFKDPFNSTAIPGKGGRAPSHGGFRSRSGTINQTPPSPPPGLSVSNLNNQQPRKERTKARAGPGGSARAGMRRGGRPNPTPRPPPLQKRFPRTGGPRRPPPHAPGHEVHGTTGAPPGRRRRLPRPPRRPRPTGTPAGAAVQPSGAEGPREPRSRSQHNGLSSDTPALPPRAPVRSGGEETPAAAPQRGERPEAAKQTRHQAKGQSRTYSLSRSILPRAPGSLRRRPRRPPLSNSQPPSLPSLPSQGGGAGGRPHHVTRAAPPSPRRGARAPRPRDAASQRPPLARARHHVTRPPPAGSPVPPPPPPGPGARSPLAPAT
ncbi:PREDICTED: proline-rich protein HaeIII subfamily 1-like [Sturnus vulgaris]|uniref:proline-rich protein HaeIII subfamily 1-like n=1 Tax=Sturnus vulgaris TaxID=9172 RepID=UPI000719F428|nr:PREDICTED: proline-rich protein HaeIII subfamily 1-like [Sturnus vulgaris]